MTEAHWKAVERIFFEAEDVPPAERQVFVARASAGDEALATEVLELLSMDAEPDTVLDETVHAHLEELIVSEELQDEPRSGTRLGQYLLLREIHRGGMGTVHLAKRVDDQYEQIVAIKTVRGGYGNVELSQQFRHERQILATLNHPNVGSILDGGETPSGMPYLVMEYVEGVPITTYSVQRNLTVRQRLELFRTACSAVYHAHGKLILHRDIKPENVLVSNEGHLKLIDFGVAKQMASSLSVGGPGPSPQQTMRWLTPNYASPEQIQGKALSVASDVYCLGVLLYEMLSGTRPYNFDGVSYVTAERILLKDNVRPPSMAVQDKRLQRQLPGDLDRIVLKAMSLDVDRRYASVQHLSDDIERFLDGRPVLAQSESIVYLLQKAATRHKTVIRSVLLSVAVLVLAFAGYRWKSRKAEAKVEEVRQFAQGTIDGMTDSAAQSGSSTELRASIARRAVAYLNQLAKSMGDDPRLLLDLSRLYIQAGDIEGLSPESNLGHTDEALASYKAALSTAEYAEARSDSPDARLAHVAALQRLGAMQRSLLKVDEAAQTYNQALAIAYPLWQQKPQAFDRRKAVIVLYEGLASVELVRLQPDAALRRLKQSLETLGARPTGDEEHDVLLADLYLRESDALNELGKNREALDAIQTAENISMDLLQMFPSGRPRRVLRAAYISMISVLVGRDFMNTGDSKRATQYADKLLALTRLLDPHDAKNVRAQADITQAYTSVGDAYRLSDPKEAALWYRNALNRARNAQAMSPSDRHQIAIVDEDLAEVLPEDHVDEQRALLAENRSVRFEQAPFTPHGMLHHMSADCKLADVNLRGHNTQAAVTLMHEAMPMLDRYDSNSPSLLVLRNMGVCLHIDAAVHLSLASSATALPVRVEEAHAAVNDLERSRRIWSVWAERGASSPESLHEAKTVDALLKTAHRLAGSH